MTKLLVGAFALTVALTASAGAQPLNATGVPLKISGLKPGTQVQVSTELDGAGAPATGAVDIAGLLNVAADVGKGGKAHVQVDIYVGKDCIDGKVYVTLVRAGADPKTLPPQCKNRTLVARIWLDDPNGATFDASVTTPFEPGNLGSGSRTNTRTRSSPKRSHKKTVTATVIVVGAGTALATTLGGGASKAATPTGTSTQTAGGTTTAGTPPATAQPGQPNPAQPTPPAPQGPPAITLASGTYTVTVTVTADINGHRTFVRYETVTTVTITITGRRIRIDGPDPWIPVEGDIDDSGRFTASGRGTVAGRSNVPITVEGQISLTDTGSFGVLAIQGNLSMNIVVGGGGSLPGTVDDGKIRYSATGRKQ